MTDTEILAAEIKRLESEQSLMLARFTSLQMEVNWLKAALGTLLFERGLSLGQVVDLETGYKH